jgi:5-methylcytosine-specific restriction protein A
VIRTIRDRLTGAVPQGKKRDPRWRAKERELVERVGSCEACGTKKRLEVHHVRPFHVAPELELQESNLIVLCRRCHQFLGHHDNWKDWNVFVRRDAEQILTSIRQSKF